MTSVGILAESIGTPIEPGCMNNAVDDTDGVDLFQRLYVTTIIQIEDVARYAIASGPVQDHHQTSAINACV